MRPFIHFFFLTVSFLFFKSQASGQVEPKLAWVKTIGSPMDNKTSKVIKDKAGNLYSIGSSEDSMDYDPGPGVLRLPANVFLTKMDTLGNLLWAKTWKGMALNNVTTDAGGNVFVCGTFAGTP